MVSRKFRSAVLVVLLAGTVALGGCVGGDTGTNATASPETEATVSPDENATTADPSTETTADSSTETTDIEATFEERMSSLDSYSATLSMQTTFDGNQTNTTTDVWARLTTDEVRREVVESPHNEGTVTVTNESRVVTYNPDTNQVTRINRTDSSQGDTGSSGLTMIDSVTDSMTIEKLGTERLDGERTHRVRMEPESTMAGGDATITAWLDADTYFPVRVETVSNASEMTFRSVVEYENVELNPEIPDERFTLDVPADANTSNFPTPDTQSYESMDALRANASMSVPQPDVPESFSLEQGRIVSGESSSVTLQYTNESVRLSVTKTNTSTYNGSGDAETVQVGDRTGQYHEFGSTGMVVWTCDGNRYSIAGGVGRETLTDVAASIECA